jgi:N-terminal region of Chorein or VPS13
VHGRHTSVQITAPMVLHTAGQGTLENVEIIPEAFDYLKLPIAIKEGSVGKLKIHVSAQPLR